MIDNPGHQLNTSYSSRTPPDVHIVREFKMQRLGYRYTLDGVGYPETARPHIEWHHIDGPLLVMRDGSLRWLTLWQRFMCSVGWVDALSLEKRHRPDLAGPDDLATMPCRSCGAGRPAGAPITADYGNWQCAECEASELSVSCEHFGPGGMWP